MPDVREVQCQRLADELRARLARVRGPMTDAAFEDLVSAVERTAERFALIDAGILRTGPNDGSR
jgi:hypothetical protein